VATDKNTIIGNKKLASLKEYEIFDGSYNYKGDFNFLELYKQMHAYLMENGYEEDKFMETLYLERNGGGGQEHWVWWRLQKKCDNKYFNLKFNVDTHTLTLKKHESVYEGRKVKGNKGEIEVFFKMILEIDPKEEWNKTSFFKSKYFMKWFFNKGYKDEIDRQIVDASGEVEKFQSMIKQFLGIKPFVKDFSGVPFHPVKGYE